MKRALFFAVAFAVAVLPMRADAQLQGFIQAQEYLDWLGGSGVASAGLVDRVQVGPYWGEFDPSGARAVTSNAFALYCVDYLHYARTSAPYQVNVYGLGGDVGDISTTRFGNQSTYLRVAYLASLFDDYTSDPDRTAAWSGLHAAIWKATSNVDLVTGSDLLVEDYFDQFWALDVPNDFDGAGWYVVSSTDVPNSTGPYDGSGQEFLVRRAVPEPGTILLMFTGLFLLVGVNRRRLAENLGH